MRILVISDIHANWPALRAIRENYDICLCLGDIVDYGTTPGPCIDWVRQNAEHTIRGNHDHGAAQDVRVSGAAGFRYLTGVTRILTCESISEDQRRYLATRPTSLALTLGGKRFFLVHATPRDPMDEYAPAEVEFWEKRLEGIDADYVLVGHTHMQYILSVGDTRVINPGSVGLPRDGDPRAGYAIIGPAGIELKRIDYPIEETIADLRASSIPDHAREMLEEVYRRGRLVVKPFVERTAPRTRTEDGSVGL